MGSEVPIKEHPGRDDPLVITVTVIAVVLSVELAELGLTKNCKNITIIAKVDPSIKDSL